MRYSDYLDIFIETILKEEMVLEKKQKHYISLVNYFYDNDIFLDFDLDVNQLYDIQNLPVEEKKQIILNKCNSFILNHRNINFYQGYDLINNYINEEQKQKIIKEHINNLLNYYKKNTDNEEKIKKIKIDLENFFKKYDKTIIKYNIFDYIVEINCFNDLNLNKNIELYCSNEVKNTQYQKDYYTKNNDRNNYYYTTDVIDFFKENKNFLNNLNITPNAIEELVNDINDKIQKEIRYNDKNQSKYNEIKIKELKEIKEKLSQKYFEILKNKNESFDLQKFYIFNLKLTLDFINNYSNKLISDNFNIEILSNTQIKKDIKNKLIKNLSLESTFNLLSRIDSENYDVNYICKKNEVDFLNFIKSQNSLSINLKNDEKLRLLSTIDLENILKEDNVVKSMAIIKIKHFFNNEICNAYIEKCLLKSKISNNNKNYKKNKLKI